MSIVDNITKGEWINKNGLIYSKNEFIANSCCLNNRISEERLENESWLSMRHRLKPERDLCELEKQSNAQLIADAGTTANKCGLLPSELLQQNTELLEALKSIQV